MLLQSLIELVAPATCLGCGRQGAVVCEACLAGVPVMAPVCYRCGVGSPGGATCAGCLADTQLQGVVVGGDHSGLVRQLVLELKFKRSRAAAVVAAQLLLRAYPLPPAVDVVTAVPIAPARYRERGYNQAELLARRVARQLGVPYRATLARHDAAHQIGRGRAQRLAAIKGSFFATTSLAGQRVLVVDDVVTTGATLAEVAATLTAAGAQTVWAGVVARRR